MRGRLSVCLLLLVAPLSLYPAPKVTIKVIGKWQLNLAAQDLVGAAGTDFPSVFESAVDEVDITVSKTEGWTAPWRVDVKRIDSNWPAGLRLFVRRTGDGTGAGTIAGGTVYQEIGVVDQLFFTGTGDRAKIDLQFRIEGVTVAVGQDTYISDIYYTLTEL